MALARSNSVNDSIKERRLRPIYELLDSGNNKKVIQEADRLLKKQPNFGCVKVLKALAVLRLGKKQEATNLVMTVFEEVPVDENTIQAMAICFRELDKPELVCDLMEKACKKDNSEDLLTFSYMSHVRVMDYMKQHKTALALYKAYPKVPYFSWAIMSLYVKAQYNDSKELAETVTLPLAERMMAKFIEDGQIDTEHELVLYTLILFKQNNYVKALKVLENATNSGVRWTQNLYANLMIECLRSGESHEKLADFLEKLISKNVDDYKYMMMYVDWCGEMFKDRVASFLKSLVDKPFERVSRPAALAQLQHYDKIAKLNLDTTGMDLKAAMLLHLRKSGGKPFYLQEVKNRLRYLTEPADRQELLDLAATLIVSDTHEDMIVYAHRRTNLEGIRYYFECDEIVKDPFAVVQCVGHLVNAYRTIRMELINEGVKLDLREVYPQEECLILASITLLRTFWNQRKFWHNFYLANDIQRFGIQEASDNAKKSPSSTDEKSFNGVEPVSVTYPRFNLPEDDFAILLNMGILEYGLEQSPCSAPLRLLLGKAYTSCGATVAGNDQFMRLDIKHIQIESLGYLYLWKAMSSGVITDSVRIAKHVELFYSNQFKESMEHVISAYKYGSWEKVMEFMKFRDVITNSLQGTVLHVEQLLLEFTTDGNSHENVLRISEYLGPVPCFRSTLNTEYRDNRDFRIHQYINEDTVPSDLVEITHKDLKERLIIRSIYLEIITNFVRASGLSSQDEMGHIYCMDNIRAALACFREKILPRDYKEYEDVYSKRCFYGPWPPSTHNYAGTGFFVLSYEFFQLAHCAGNQSGSPGVSEYLSVLTEKLNDATDFFIESWKKAPFLFINFANLIEEAYHVIESLGFICIVADALKCFVTRPAATPTTTDAKGRRRKAKEPPTEKQSCKNLDVFVKALVNNLSKMEKQISEFRFGSGKWFPTTWCELQGMFRGKVSDELMEHVLPYSLPTVTDKLNRSYYRACAEMKLNAGLKRKFAETILKSISS